MITCVETFAVINAEERLKTVLWSSDVRLPLELQDQGVKLTVRNHTDTGKRRESPDFYVALKKDKHDDEGDDKKQHVLWIKAQCVFQAGDDKSSPTHTINEKLVAGGVGYGPPVGWLTWSRLRQLCDSYGVFALSVTITITEIKRSADQSHLQLLQKNYQDAFDKRGGGDIAVLIENDSFRAHSQVLSIRSPVLDRMLQGPFAEKTDREIDMRQFSPRLCLDFVRYLYVGDSTGFQVTKLSEAVDLYKIADYYQVPILCQQALDHVLVLAKQNVKSPETLRQVFLFARTVVMQFPVFATRLREALSGNAADLIQYAMQV